MQLSSGSFSMSFSGHHASLSPAEIERELSTMWKDAGDSADSPSSVTRVVLGNLICIAPSCDMERVGDLIRRVVPKFPCRLFLLEYKSESTESTISASINAQCFVPKAGAGAVCCEMIRLVFGPNSARHLRGCVGPLLLPDLQTVLWENLAGGSPPHIDEVRSFADRIITRAAVEPNPASVLQKLADSKRPDFELAWFRLAPIRDQITGFFDDPQVPVNLDRLSAVKLTTCRSAGSVPARLSAALLAGWIADNLGWSPTNTGTDGSVFQAKGGKVSVEIIENCCEKLDVSDQHLRQIELHDRDGDVFHMVLAHCGGAMDLWASTAATSNDRMTRLQVAEMAEHAALGLALNTPTSTRKFRAAARTAVKILGSTSKG